jgi:hypothetical protein
LESPVKAAGVEPASVLTGGFTPMLRKIPCKYGSISHTILLAWTKIRSGKTAMHLSARNFRAIFDAADAALLTQGKDNKAKSAEKGRRQAVWVRLPSP